MSRLALILLAAGPLFGQLPSHTVTITATRSIAVQPDEVVFGVTVSSSQTTNLDQIVAALASTGVTLANPTGTDNNNAPLLDWDFTLATPIANLASTLTTLMSLQKTIALNNSGLGLIFAVSGLKSSQQQAQSCSDADLIADATAQAQKLIAAANVTLGPIVKLSNVTPPASFGVAQLVPTAALALYPGFAPANYPTPLTCSLTVQFQLLP